MAAAVAVLRENDPRRIGGYELVGRLGEGGQGAVFLGREPSGGRQVAIKLLHAELNDNERARSRFLGEFEVAMRVAPFCTAQVLDVNVEDGRPYIVSEYVPGPSLHHQVAGEGPLTGGALQRVAVGTVTALVAIHQAGVVHRDFKPGNVLLGPAGARVIDFGIARALDVTTKTGGMVGTPLYMAPEQVRGERAGPPIDVFAWGATIGYAATGRAPFGADTLPAVIHRVLNGEPDLGGLDGRLREIVERCLLKDAAQRPEARDILMFLLGQGEAPAAAPAPAPAPRPAPTPLPTPPVVPAPEPTSLPDSVVTGMLQAGHDLAAQRTPEATLPPGAPPPPPAAFRQPPAAFQQPPAAFQQPPAAFQQPPPAALPHQITIDPFRAAAVQPKPARKGRKAVLAAASGTAAVALLTGVVLLSPLFEQNANGRMSNQQSPLPTVTASQTQGTSQATPSTTETAEPTPTETGGYTEEPTPTPSWTPTHRPTYTPSPTHTPTTDPTPTPSPTETSDPCAGAYPPPTGCSGY